MLVWKTFILILLEVFFPYEIMVLYYFLSSTQYVNYNEHSSVYSFM